MSEPPRRVPPCLEYRGSQMWKGELAFISRKDNETVATVLITQCTTADVLRLDWNGAAIAELDRRPFANWLRTGWIGDGTTAQPFVARKLSEEGEASAAGPGGGTATDRPGEVAADQVTWFWKGRDLRVVITGIEHVFAAIALPDLLRLAVR